MTFVFDEEAGASGLRIDGETYKYLIKVRRHARGDTIAFRNPEQPEMLYLYELQESDGRRAHLQLRESREARVGHRRSLHLGWCAIDMKSVEKVLPQLNELGVGKITFIGCERSQKGFRPDFLRLTRILHSSMQQCGRSEMMELAECDGIPDFLAAFPEAVAFDFCDRVFEPRSCGAETVLIGPEGGFCDRERDLIGPERRFRLDTPMILRSETAAVAVAGALLLC